MPARPFYEIAPGALPEITPEEVGGKAWGLMRVAAAGLTVPPGFVLPTSWCRRVRAQVPEAALTAVLSEGVAALEKRSDLSFGSCRRPLLLSVRSGCAVSMPGMLETVLNIGLNPDSVEGLIRLTGNPKLAWDCYRRLIEGYARVVQGLPAAPFDELLVRAVSRCGVESARELDFRPLRQLAMDMRERFHDLSGKPFPDDPAEQLHRATVAVFRSWDAPKAAVYRQLNGITDEAGTAVTVQRMVFGNAAGESGSGVGFTRNPATGERELYLDFRFHAQGEDLVAGRQRAGDHDWLRRSLPAVWKQIESTSQTLEALFRDAQDFEFTLERGVLYLLQSRDAKRSDWAALRIAVELVREGLIDTREAQQRLSGIDVAHISRTRIHAHSATPITVAQTASCGVASGAVALDSAAAEQLAKSGPVILVRHDIDTSDIRGIASASGILTASGSRTSHAAVVARRLGKVCLVGCMSLDIDWSRRSCRIGTGTLREGDILSLDGNEGRIYAGTVDVVTEHPEQELRDMAAWTHDALAAKNS